MNKRLGKLLILILVVAALVVCVVLIGKTKAKDDDTSDDKTADAAITVFDLSPSDITHLTYTNKGEETLSFSAQNGQWSYDGDPQFPLSQNSLDSMTQAFCGLEASRVLDENEAYSEYGLDDPRLLIEIEAGDKKISVAVGNYNSYTSGYYTLTEGKIYVTDSSLINSFGNSLFDFLTTTELPKLENVNSFVVDGNVIDDEETVASLAESYSSLGRGEVADYRDKEKYGFDGTEHIVTVNYTVETEVTDAEGQSSTTVKSDGSFTFTFASVDGTSYLMLQDDDLVYHASGTEAFVISEKVD